MEAQILDGLLFRHRELVKFLREHEELSLAIDVEVSFKRSFVVACGSYCEHALCDLLECFAGRHGDKRLTVFVRQRALERRYHDMFDWSAANTNRFFSFFGDGFRCSSAAALKNDPENAAAAAAFLEIGRLRNLVAHEFATASVDRTVDELEQLARRARAFLMFVQERLELSGEELPNSGLQQTKAGSGD